MRASQICQKPSRGKSLKLGQRLFPNSLSSQRPLKYQQCKKQLKVLCTATESDQIVRQDVLRALERIIDPDFGENIVDCGFVKQLQINQQSGSVSFQLELTTPACPVKDEFQRQAEMYVGELQWVKDVQVQITSQPKPLTPSSDRPEGLKDVKHVIAVSSCKGGVGKSTVSVNLAFTLAQMGAKVGILDADVYGPSLPTMVSPEQTVMEMNPQTRALIPTEYEGIKLVSFGFAGQGSAIMRGPMVSGLIQQLLISPEWGELDYLIVDFPPGTGDIQLTLCQSVGFSAAVIVTTPQKLAFVDVAKGIRMFARLMVPCVAVVENMSYFEVEGVKHFPFGQGSGDKVMQDFGLPHLVKFPIVPDLSMCGDGGKPLVVENPTCQTSRVFMDLGAILVREVAKLQQKDKNQVQYVEQEGLISVKLSNQQKFYLETAVVRRNDTSAVDPNDANEQVPDDIKPQSMTPLGNYAVQISWEDGKNQVASYELLDSLPKVESMASVEKELASQLSNSK